ncbi:uncharacterized protein ARMOST_20049 [Armillaria ostoyae]|uniref:Uncharacterized protein n=1 Tax=Armillaria ostoyae TaxID=47428 RepID=A0A284S685_ARMOS|nr:uncharacterized protein ARMOST_20049 [Armillaria ostoyae]
MNGKIDFEIDFLFLLLAIAVAGSLSGWSLFLQSSRDATKTFNPSQQIHAANRQGLAFDRRFIFGFSWSTKSECAPSEKSTRWPKMAVRLCPNIRPSFTTTTIIARKLPRTTRLSAMISALQINIVLRRAFKDRYQKRETKAKISSKGETVRSQVSIVTENTSKHTFRFHAFKFLSLQQRPQQKLTLTKRTRNPLLAERLLRRLVIDIAGIKKFWRCFATLPQPSGWDCNHINYLIHAYRVLPFNAIIISGEYSDL